MPQSLSQILLHIVFGTKYRARSIPLKRAPALHTYLAGVCRRCGSTPYRVGGTDDHVHIACSLPRTLTIAKLVEKVKSNSSRWLKETFPDQCLTFAWQNGYGAFSLTPSHLRTLTRYIDNQLTHHGKVDYNTELVKLLDDYDVEYDPEHLWD